MRLLWVLAGVVALPADLRAEEVERVSVLVHFESGAERADVRGFAVANGGAVRYEYQILPNVVNLRGIPATAVADLEAMPGVAHVEPDLPVSADILDSTPLIRGLQEDITAQGLTATGAGVRVCVCDTGILTDHIMYADQVDHAAGYDFVNNDDIPEDDNGHGTHVAGIAVGKDGLEVYFPCTGSVPFQGIGCEATLIGVKVLEADGTGSTSDVIQGIQHCASSDLPGGRADVINLSLSDQLPCPGECDSRALAVAANNVVAAGVVLVASSGNNGYSNGLPGPACASGVIAVGATWDDYFPNACYPGGTFEFCLYYIMGECALWCTDEGPELDQITCYSNQSNVLDVTAPGSRIWSADYSDPGMIVAMHGTSQAAPHVSGLAALILDIAPAKNPYQVRQIIRRGAIDLGPPGFDSTFGHGRIDVVNSLWLALICEDDVECNDGDPCNGDEYCHPNGHCETVFVADCNANGFEDSCDIDQGTSEDCQAVGEPGHAVPDDCDIDPEDPDGDGHVSADCQPDGVPDECQLDGSDCNGNMVPDDCDIAHGTSLDCHSQGVLGYGIPDECDLDPGDPDGDGHVSPDCQPDFVPDECQLDGNDCNGNMVPDDCDIFYGTSEDCQEEGPGLGIPDECDVHSGDPDGDGHVSADCQLDVIPDECQLDGNDCNANAVPDDCDMTYGTSEDCQQIGEPGYGIPDECDVDPEDPDGDGEISLDCQPDFVPDECQLDGNDCNGNMVPDDCDIIYGTSEDCQEEGPGQGIPDECDVDPGDPDGDEHVSADCQTDGVPDECQLDGNDCNGNMIPDDCDILHGTSEDCQEEGPGQDVPDECDVDPADPDGDGHVSPDCQPDVVPDECQLDGNDCNDNDVPDDCDIARGTSEDCQAVDEPGYAIPDECDVDPEDPDGDGHISPDCQPDGIPDECQLDGNDCNGNVVPDDCDIAHGTSEDCQEEGPGRDIPDECDVDPADPDGDGHVSADCQTDTIPDECQLDGNDCNGNMVPDDCDMAHGTSQDCQDQGDPGYGIPDECDIDPTDPDGDGHVSTDCQPDDIPDECQVDGNDCNGNTVPDDCDMAYGTSQDCQDQGDPGYGIPDECDIDPTDPDGDGHVSADCQPDGVPDDCQLDGNDCNGNESPDECDPDCDGNGVPDDCDPPVMVADGCRCLAITPQPSCSMTPVALYFTSPAETCLSLYVDTGGLLVETPVFRTPGQWLTVRVYGEAVIPNTVYTVQAETAAGARTDNDVSTTTYVWGDVNGDEVVGIDDILLIIAGFKGDFTQATIESLDLYPCLPNRLITLDDILWCIWAYKGATYWDTQCPDPCP